MINSFDGGRMPFRKTGIAFRTAGNRFASHAEKTHQELTKRNCTIVRVTGFGKAVRIAFDDVLDRIDVAYQTPQSTLIALASMAKA